MLGAATYCSVTRAATALGRTRANIKRRMDAMGFTVEQLRAFKAEQRRLQEMQPSLPLKPPPRVKVRTKSATSGL